MSTIDLVVLGILLQGAKNAYELVRYIREREIHRVLKVSEPAVFKSCRRLAEAGYLDGETVHEPGVPDKVVYEVNSRGRARFDELMGHFVQDFRPFYLEINAVLWNIGLVDQAEGKRLLLSLQQQLHAAKTWVTAHEQEVREILPFGPRQIVKQYGMTLSALSDWIDQAVDDYELD
ncbi:MAG: PadR family transcriptional regulator [Myxococcota bacterium]